MEYYSHSTTGPDGKTVGSKTLKKHIAGVLEKALLSFRGEIGFNENEEDIKKLIQTLVRFHDFGKFTSYFQNFLLKKGSTDQDLKQHARIGGIAAYNYLKGINEKHARIALYLIFRHHAHLNNIEDFKSVFDERLSMVFEIQKKDLLNIQGDLTTILNIEKIQDLLNYPDAGELRELRRSFNIWQKKEAQISDYFLINYLFSILIEADKLDASDTRFYFPKAIHEGSVDNRFGRPELKINFKDDNIDDLRNYCRAEVISHLGKENILDVKIFTLTAPTGIGKTMTALDFAIKLKAKLSEKKKSEARIVYALPFINIIEQALREYQSTLPEYVRILGHYQFADVFGKEQEDTSDVGTNYQQKLMEMDTWQADVIITSFVQFFETLIGNRNKVLKKFNHLAGSIIILDEVQTLRIEQMPLIGATLFYLAKYLDARIILMTATKPKIFELAQKEILEKENEIVAPFELLTSHKKVFKLFKRTRIYPILDYSFEESDKVSEFIEKIYLKKWSPEKSCIIVCNTVNRSIELHQKISEHFQDNKLENPIEYLSTNIIPKHRFERIQRIRDWLKQGKAPLLISTQVVEAGVDLDFDIGFRDLGPIDSIIQVAGRINRNNNYQKKYSPLYIVDFGDASKIYGSLTASQARKALSGRDEIPENIYLDLVDGYFENISSKNSFERFNRIFESMKMLRYDSENPEEEMPISKFKIIEESRSSSAVFVEFDKFAVELRKKYLDKIKGQISKEDFERDYKLAFHQHIITVPDYFTTALEPINEFDKNLLCIPLEIIHDCYNPLTGFIRSKTDRVVML